MKKLKVFINWLTNLGFLYLGIALYLVAIVILSKDHNLNNYTLASIIMYAMWIIVFVIVIVYNKLKDEIRASREITINLDKDALEKAISDLNKPLIVNRDKQNN